MIIEKEVSYIESDSNDEDFSQISIFTNKEFHINIMIEQDDNKDNSSKDTTIQLVIEVIKDIAGLNMLSSSKNISKSIRGYGIFLVPK